MLQQWRLALVANFHADDERGLLIEFHNEGLAACGENGKRRNFRLASE